MKKIGDPQFFGEMEHLGKSSPLCIGCIEQDFSDYGGVKATMCFCNTDLCNSANFMQPGPGGVLIILLFLSNIIYLV